MFKRLKNNKKIKGLPPVKFDYPHIQEDEIELQLEDVIIRVRRKLNLLTPHEVTVVIPRVELRERHYKNGQLTRENERLYNSITVVHAPRHSLENPPAFGAPKPPASPPFPKKQKI
ncbi:hypothetical protein V6C27_07435 [Peptococcaceae bacterium 1198_IL3148]